jgi:hypothetical protein
MMMEYRKIAQFVEMLIHHRVLDDSLEAGYELMAQDEARETEALEWIEGTFEGDNPRPG